MKKIKIVIMRQALPVFLFGIIGLMANAQKLPNTQTTSLRAPANIKVDGKTTEWDNKFQAYNHATDVYYTISNDDNNLYLTIQANQPSVIRRIINGGITLTINKSGQKKGKDGISITYPIFDKKNRFTPNFRTTDEPGYRKSDDLISNTITRPDSLVNATNKSFGEKAKLISVTGVKNIDSLISVYNADGIKAVALFDHKMVYTYELAVTLKNLGLSVSDPTKFAYQLRINEMQTSGFTITTKDGETTNTMPTDVSTISSFHVGEGAVMGQSATDFWGEYTLAQK